MIRITLYLGFNINGKPGVDENAFREFLEDTVTPAFPAFTVQRAIGYWEGAPERSAVVSVLAEVSDVPKAETLARAYAREFSQQCVLLEVTPIAAVQFVERAVPAANLTLIPVGAAETGVGPIN